MSILCFVLNLSERNESSESESANQWSICHTWQNIFTDEGKCVSMGGGGFHACVGVSEEDIEKK